MKSKFQIVGIFFAILMLLASCVGSSEKKEISIAYANWAEGIAMTNLVKTILQDEGYKVDLLNADIAPIFTSISRKKSDLYLDMWMPVTHADYMDKYGQDLEVLGQLYDNARIGLVVPEYVTVNSIEELNQYKDKFDEKIVGIDAGAGIMKASDKALKVYNLEYKLMTSSGPAMTASLKKAIDEKQWIVVTGWTPHWMFSRYDLKMLKDPKKVYGAAEKVQAIGWKGFSEEYPYVSKFIHNIKFDDAQISSLMKEIEESDKIDVAVRRWMDNHEALIKSWLPKK